MIKKSKALRLLSIVGLLGVIAVSYFFTASTPKPDSATTSNRPLSLSPISISEDLDTSVFQLTGKVLSENTNGIVGALVCASGKSQAAEKTCGETDATGQYTIMLVKGRYAVAASARYYASISQRVDVVAPTALDFALLPAKPVISGRVHNSIGQPVVGALIHIFQRQDHIVTAMTTDEGIFDAWAPSGPLSLNVEADGFTITKVRAVAPSGDLDITLYPGATVAGRVIDAESDEPVANLRVFANQQGQGAGGKDVVSSDSEGYFKFDRLNAARWSLTVEDQRYYTKKPMLVIPSTSETPTDIELLVYQGAEVSGQIVIDESLACDSGMVQLHLNPEAIDPSSTKELLLESQLEEKTLWVAKTDEDGKVNFPGLPMGRYLAGAICDESQFVDGPRFVEVTEPTSDDLTWYFETGLQLTVQVIDEANRAVLEANVSLNKIPDGEGQANWNSSRQIAADENGIHHFGGLEPGEYELIVRPPGINGAGETSKTLYIQESREPLVVEIVLPGAGGLEIFARDEDGAPLSQQLFFALDSEGERYEAFYTGDGRYLISPMLFGHYALYSYDNKNPKVRLQDQGRDDIDIQDQALKVIDFIAESRQGVIEGRVYDAQGSPMVGAAVRAVSATLDADDEFYAVIQEVMHGKQYTLTDDNGFFRIPKLVEDSAYDLYLQSDHGQSVVEKNQYVGEFVEINLFQLSGLSGQVKTQEGNPVEKVLIVLNYKESGKQIVKDLASPGGNFTIKELPPGLVNLQVIDTETRVGQSEAIDIELIAGRNSSNVKVILHNCGQDIENSDC